MVKPLQPDNGCEYVSNNFEDFFSHHGIQHEPTIPHSLQLNGIAKLMDQTLMETAWSMLYYNQELLKFWAEAVSIACYIRNWTPTTFLTNLTPHEHWYGKTTDVSNLKVFGCKAYVHIPDSKRKYKFDRESVLCVFVWISSKWQWIQILQPTNKSNAPDVIFVEDRFDVEKLDCTQENFEFFIGSVGKVENNDGECKNEQGDHLTDWMS